MVVHDVLILCENGDEDSIDGRITFVGEIFVQNLLPNQNSTFTYPRYADALDILDN